MLAFLFNYIFAFAEAAKPESGWNKFLHFYEEYLNYPGFEAWRFFNLILFVLIMVYLLKKPLSEAFKAKREQIRSELIKAEEEKQAAISQMTATEAKLANLDAESQKIRSRAEAEAASETSRINNETEFEVSKLREQATSEIERRSKQAKQELRRFSAEESIRRAEEKIRAEINAEKDARLVKASIQSIGGLN